ncbi:hypothetical protein ACIGB8_28815 [Promicromonospora sukumoe]|uniref:hypothetical protein n=1 Tax=Promicromonospora sukumoe TaxID=88382 RepID=UPI0037C7186C
MSDDRTEVRADYWNDDRTANGVKGDLSNADWQATYDAWKSPELAAASLAEARAEYWKLDAEVAAEREAARAELDA